MLHQCLLNGTKQGHLCLFDKPVCMQGFSCSDNHRRRQRKRIDECLLFLESFIVHLHKLCIDASNAVIGLTAGVHHKKDAMIFLVMFFQSGLHCKEFSCLHGHLGTGKDAFFPIIKNTQTYRIVRVEDSIDHVLCRYVHTTSSISSVKYRIGICLRFAHWISCAMPSEILLPNTHSWTHFVRST